MDTTNTMFRIMINLWRKKARTEEEYTGGLSSISNVLFHNLEDHKCFVIFLYFFVYFKYNIVIFKKTNWLLEMAHMWLS